MGFWDDLGRNCYEHQPLELDACLGTGLGRGGLGTWRTQGCAEGPEEETR